MFIWPFPYLILFSPICMISSLNTHSSSQFDQCNIWLCLIDLWWPNSSFKFSYWTLYDQMQFCFYFKFTRYLIMLNWSWLNFLEDYTTKFIFEYTFLRFVWPNSYLILIFASLYDHFHTWLCFQLEVYMTIFMDEQVFLMSVWPFHI
jgi:hypothetical protein